MSDSTGSRPLNWAERRAIVLDRAGYECAECGDTATEADHMWPRKHGGTDEFDNLQALCRTCNAAKGDSLLIEHMTPARLWAAATLELTSALNAINQAVRFAALADLLSDGVAQRTAHDQIGVDPAEFPLVERQRVVDFLSKRLLPSAAESLAEVGS